MGAAKKMIAEHHHALSTMRVWFFNNYDFSASECDILISSLLEKKYHNKFSSYSIQEITTQLEITSKYCTPKSNFSYRQDNDHQELINQKNSFLAIDFETANSNRNSACALGLVKVIKNEIVNYEYYLIKPPTTQFRFTHIHGIKYDDVKYAPTFKDIWPIIKSHLKDVKSIVAHNVAFDKDVLRMCCESNGIFLPNYEYRCTVKVARELWNIRPTKLTDVCKHFNIPLNHHNAGSDVIACAKIMLIALNRDVLDFNHCKINLPDLITNENLIEANKKIIQENKKQEFTIENNFSRSSNIQQKTESDGCFKIIFKIIGIIILLYLFTKLFSCGDISKYNSPFYKRNINEIIIYSYFNRS